VEELLAAPSTSASWDSNMAHMYSAKASKRGTYSKWLASTLSSTNATTSGFNFCNP